MRPPVRAAIAAALSCSIYAIPLLGPHAVFVLGESMVRQATRGQQSGAWLAAEVAGALALQVVAGGVWYWILGNPRSLRPFVLLFAVPGCVIAAQWYYLVALPTRFLIDRDVAVEQRTWASACTIPERSLVVVGYKPAVVRAADPLLVSDSAAHLARVTMTPAAGGATTCATAPLAGPAIPTKDAPTTESPAWIGEDGRMLISSIAKHNGAQGWLWVARAGVPPAPLNPPDGHRASDGAPVVSSDGGAIGWLTAVPNSGQPPQLTVVVRRLPPAATPDDVAIDLAPLGLASFVLRDVDVARREVLLARNERSFVAVGFDGTPHGAPVRPEGVDPLHMTFRRVANGWVAWDGYKEDGYTIAWSLPGGHGTHRVPRGRGITDVAVHPDGRLIGVSVTTSLSIGNTPDAVYVLRVADGAEVFRRYLARYTRSAVLFPAPDLFAYTEYDGTHATTMVLHIAAAALR